MHWPDCELCRQLGISPNTLRNYRGKGKARKPVHIPRYVALAVLALSHDLGKLEDKTQNAEVRRSTQKGFA